ncbi:MAG: DUF5671 domain-containing protein [Paracoccaceae bacterium]
MRASDQLADFVGQALAQGRSRDEISAALSQAGWKPEEVARAQRAWAALPFSPPVPRPRPALSAAAGMFLSLVLTAWHAVWLGFQLIERWLPDPAEAGYFDPDGLRWTISVLIVAVPVFLLTNARTVRAERADAGRRRSAVGRWFSYTTLFLALLAMTGDLVAAIFAALSGDLTARFLAKVALVALVSGLIALYFRARLEEVRDDAAT